MQPLVGNCPGSIPARTGEPADQWTLLWLTRVYPRSHGGTFGPHMDALSVVGLSPLARGNQDTLTEWLTSKGSIPARTGEPSRRAAK